MYHLTICDRDGSLVAELPDSPVVPRFLHFHRSPDDDVGDIELSDTPDPEIEDAHTVSFARVASSVWVDEARSALYVRVQS